MLVKNEKNMLKCKKKKEKMTTLCLFFKLSPFVLLHTSCTSLITKPFVHDCKENSWITSFIWWEHFCCYRSNEFSEYWVTFFLFFVLCAWFHLEQRSVFNKCSLGSTVLWLFRTVQSNKFSNLVEAEIPKK